MKNFLVAALVVALVLPSWLGAQNDAAPGKVGAPQTTKLLPCKEAMAAATVNLQSRANAECQSVYQCLECLTEKNARTCKPVVAHPQPRNCPMAAQEVAAEAPPAANKPANPQVEAVPFQVVILQNVCFATGTSLEVFVAQDGEAKPDAKAQSGYSYLWEIDGGKGGHAARIECVQGNIAKVTVTKLATGQSVTKRVKLAQGTSAPKPDHDATLIASYKKTGCFGTCPIYEVQFFSDGTATWNGQMNVGTSGKSTKKLDPAMGTKLEEQALIAKFFTLKDHYPDYKVWDAPSTVIYLNLNGKEKTVVDILDAPASLKKLESYFDSIIAAAGWKTQPGLPSGPGTPAPAPPKKD